MTSITKGQQIALENAAKICNDRLISYMQDDLCRVMPYICVPRHVWNKWREILDPNGAHNRALFIEWLGANKTVNNVYRRLQGLKLGLPEDVIEDIIYEFRQKNKKINDDKKKQQYKRETNTF